MSSILNNINAQRKQHGGNNNRSVTISSATRKQFGVAARSGVVSPASALISGGKHRSAATRRVAAALLAISPVDRDILILSRHLCSPLFSLCSETALDWRRRGINDVSA